MIRQTLDYQLLHQGDPQASTNIDKILSKAYNIPYLTLFLYRNTKKRYFITFSQLVNNQSVSDYEVGRSLSSLLNSLLNELPQEETLYQPLKISTISSLLSQFLQGEINQQPIKDFFKEYLL